MQLFPYQVEGARFLADRKRALLADDMGLGKSAQAIAACDLLSGDATPPMGFPDALRILVVCPASVRENWRREFDRFANIKHRVHISSYDKVARADTFDVSRGSEPAIDVLILDEAHYLKNRTAKRTKAIFGPKCDGVGGLIERAKHVFCLTGTPTPNNPAELWPMLRAVMPGAILKSERGVCLPAGTTPAVEGVGQSPLESRSVLPYWSFVQKYCVTRNNGFGIEIVRGKNLDELRERIAPFVLRRRKAEVLKDLPPIRFAELPVEGAVDGAFLDEGVWGADEVKKALREEGVAGLAKIATHVATLRRMTGLAKVAPVVEWVKDWLEGGGKKIVLFAHHRDVIEALYDGLGRERGGAIMLHGGLDAKQRQYAIDAFQSHDKPTPCRVFIGQIQAAGTGITLTAASDVLFVESSWVPADNEQAAMRVHRIGQKSACLVRFAMLAGSIDEQVQRAVMRKTEDVKKLWGE